MMRQRSHVKRSAARPRKRARKPRPPASVKPWRGVTILAVDTAARSGWAHYFEGQLIASGEVNIEDADDVLRVCMGAVHANDGTGEPSPPCVLVLERPFGGSNSGTLMAVGAARHVWLQAWKRASGKASRIVRVYPATWRARLFGTTRGTVPMEMHRALGHKARLPAAGRGGPSVRVGPDEAAAICIGEWATRAGEVGAVLGKRLRALTEAA